jgi:hypothetical protein
VRIIYATAALSFVFLGELWYLWPSVFNIENFGFLDVGSSLTVDVFLGRHLRPAIDFGYIYGLLPVLVQHVLATLFGRGPWIIIGLGIAYLFASAFVWALIWNRLGASIAFLTAVIFLSPYLIMHCPPPAHGFNQLSLMLVLLSLLQGRLVRALVFSVIGWLSMPSLPLVAIVLISFWIAVIWWKQPHRRIRGLMKQFLPATAVYVVLLVVLAAIFGFESVRQTLLPFNGAAHYRANGYGILGQGLTYLYPPGVRVTYYLGTEVGWWLLSTVILAALAVWSVFVACTKKDLSFRVVFIVSCFVLHVAFILLAFGNGFQKLYYYPILIAGVLAGLWEYCRLTARTVILVGLVGISLLGQYSSLRFYWKDRHFYERSDNTASFYASPSFASEWQQIVRLGVNKKLVILSFGNGIGEYFPAVETPDSIFLLPVYLTEPAKRKLLEEILHADIVVEKIGDTEYVDGDSEFQKALAHFRHKEVQKNFIVWQN